MTGNNHKMKLGEFLPYRLSVLTNKISCSLTTIYEQQYKLSSTEWRIIAVLAEQTDLSAAEVAERTAMDKVPISRAVKNLLANGRLKRHFSEEDRRRSVLSLTKEGLGIYEKIVPEALAYESNLLEKLNQQERHYLDLLLTKLVNIQDDIADI